jgi:hypothetical protein
MVWTIDVTAVCNKETHVVRLTVASGPTENSLPLLIRGVRVSSVTEQPAHRAEMATTGGCDSQAPPNSLSSNLRTANALDEKPDDRRGANANDKKAAEQ